MTDERDAEKDVGRCGVCEAVTPSRDDYCEDHRRDEDTGPVVVERIDWTKPCPAPLRCADRKFCPPACREAGSREDPNHRPDVTSPTDSKETP